MAGLEVRRYLDDGYRYLIKFNPSKCASGVSTSIERSFEDCLYFIIREFFTRIHLVPTMQPFELNVIDLPSKQRKIIEGIVELYNRSPDLYDIISSRESLESLAKHFEHELISAD